MNIKRLLAVPAVLFLIAVAVFVSQASAKPNGHIVSSVDKRVVTVSGAWYHESRQAQTLEVYNLEHGNLVLLFGGTHIASFGDLHYFWADEKQIELDQAVYDTFLHDQSGRFGVVVEGIEPPPVNPNCPVPPCDPQIGLPITSLIDELDYE